MTFLLLGSPATQWRQLLNGAGGYMTGMQGATDNTVIVRTDTYGSYKWNPTAVGPTGATGLWQQLVNSSSMPTAFVSGSTTLASDGVYEIQMCKGNSNLMYMTYVDTQTVFNAANSTVYKSTNGGLNWSYTNFGEVSDTNVSANTSFFKQFAPKIAVEPITGSKVYVGTLNVLYVTTDGGNTWSTVSSSLIPIPTGLGGYCGMVFDPTDVTSNTVYITSDGNGVYKTTNGGTSWIHLTTGTGPVQTVWAAIDEAAGSFQGTYYVFDQTAGEIWSWNGTTWTSLLTPNTSLAGFAVDTTTSGHLVAYTGAGLFQETTNAGGSWSAASASPVYSGGDIGWITPGLSSGAFFDRTTVRKIWIPSNQGPTIATWTGSIGSSTNVAVSVTGRGLEQLVGNSVIVAPSHSPLTLGWDFGTRYLSNLSAYPTSYGPNNGQLAAAWSGSLASSDNSNRIVVYADGTYAGFGNQSGYSDDGGQTWTLISSTLPAGSDFGGCIAASTSTNWLVSTAGVQQPSYTSNAGASWTPITISGISDWSGVGAAYFWVGKWLAADTVNQGQFTLMIAGGANAGFYQSTNGGVSWTSLGNSNSAAQGSGAQLKSVPGQANNLWLSTGPTAAGLVGADQFTLLMYSTNGGSTWNSVTNMMAPASVGFSPSGGSYPIVGTAGALQIASTSTVTFGTGNKSFTITGSPAHTILPGAACMLTNSSLGNMRGQIVSYTGGVLTVAVDTLISGSGSASSWTIDIWGVYTTSSGAVTTPTWNQIGTFPAGSLDEIKDIAGDPSKPNRWYLSLNGSGFQYYG